MLKQRDPLVQKLFLALQERIEAGHYQAGTWLPAERALSLEFGVDRSVVRAAFEILQERNLIVRVHGRRPWVRDRLPAATGSQQHSHRSIGVQTITVILPQHAQFPSSLEILRGINAALRLNQQSYRLVTFDNHTWRGRDDDRLERQALEAISADESAGVILWPMMGWDILPQLQELRAQGIPIVCIDRIPADFEGDFVGVDNRASAREAVEYLLSLGHTRIAHLTNSEKATTTLERRAGYCEALRLHGLPDAPELIHVQLQGLPLVSHAEYLLNLDDPPTAVFTLNDNIAHLFIADLERHGRSVPQDMSVIGFDDVERFSARPPLLTTMRQPFDLIGQRAAELLLHRLANKDQERPTWRHILLPTTLQVRSTCLPKQT